jgi:hypothetical protein
MGQILVRHGVLRHDQVMQILKQQLRRPRPFGLIAEQQFGVTAAAVEAAWLEQYQSCAVTAAPLDMAPDPAVHDVLSRRQVWQFRALPTGREDGWLTVATDAANLKRVLLFLERVVPEPVHVQLADAEVLTAALSRTYGPSPVAARALAAAH